MNYPASCKKPPPNAAEAPLGKIGKPTHAQDLRIAIRCGFVGSIRSDTRLLCPRHHEPYACPDGAQFKPVTKFSARVDHVSRLPDVLRQAFRAATTGTPGPAHIEVAGHMGELEEQVDELTIVPEPQFGRVPGLRSLAEPAAVAQAARQLEKADRPVIVAGGGVRSSGAGAELTELAECLAIPVATSMNAKDVLPGNHRLNVGVPGTYSRKSANQVVLEADLVFFIGSLTGSQVTGKWRVPRPGTPVVQLDINPEELGRHYPNQVSLLGDVKATLGQLIEAADASTAANRAAWVARTEALGREWREEFAEVMNSDAVPIRPERLCKDLSELMPADTLLVADTGHAGMWTGGMIDLDKPGQGFIRTAGSLGWGLPAALGAKLALPGRPVLLFSGDGGFWYHLSELETAARYGINAVMLINNNKSLNQTADVFKDAYGGKLTGQHGKMWQFMDVNFTDIARTMGVEGIRVQKPGELSGALDKAFSLNKPCVVEVMTDIDAMAPLAFLG